MFFPSDTQLEMLAESIKDLMEIGDFEIYPTVPTVTMPRCALKATLLDMIEPNDCYSNTFEILAYLMMTHGYKHERLRYVTGIALSDGHPVPHAWIKIDADYFDISWETLAHQTIEDNTYYAMAELELYQLSRATEANEWTPPCPVSILKNSPEYLTFKQPEE
jgi:hypothetical protein